MNDNDYDDDDDDDDVRCWFSFAYLLCCSGSAVVTLYGQLLERPSHATSVGSYSFPLCFTCCFSLLTYTYIHTYTHRFNCQFPARPVSASCPFAWFLHLLQSVHPLWTVQIFHILPKPSHYLCLGCPLCLLSSRLSNCTKHLIKFTAAKSVYFIESVGHPVGHIERQIWRLLMGWEEGTGWTLTTSKIRQDYQESGVCEESAWKISVAWLVWSSSMPLTCRNEVGLQKRNGRMLYVVGYDGHKLHDNSYKPL